MDHFERSAQLIALRGAAIIFKPIVFTAPAANATPKPAQTPLYLSAINSKSVNIILRMCRGDSGAARRFVLSAIVYRQRVVARQAARRWEKTGNGQIFACA